jgi:hypothetical protein
MRKGRVLAAVAIAIASTCVLGVGDAHADPVLSVGPSTTGLTDGQSVTAHVTGINAVALAHLEFSECANAYANGTPLDSLTKTTDCKVLGGADVSSTPTIDVPLTIMQTGIGTADRSCIHAG